MQTAVVRSDSKRKTRARHDWLERIVARWEVASGVAVPTDRLIMLAKELDDRNYQEAIARVAEEWILRGDSIKYGRLTLASFYPTEEQIASLGLNIDRILARARAEGYADGFAAGKLAANDSIAEDLRYIELLSRTKRIRRYAERVEVIRRRDRELDEKEHRLRAEASSLQRTRLIIQRRLAALLYSCCRTDRKQIEHAIESIG